MTRWQPCGVRRFRVRSVLASLLGVVVLLTATWFIDCEKHVMRPLPDLDGPSTHATGRFGYDVPLDPASPWPKFRADARQSGRSPVRPVTSDRRPWVFPTGRWAIPRLGT